MKASRFLMLFGGILILSLAVSLSFVIKSGRIMLDVLRTFYINFTSTITNPWVVMSIFGLVMIIITLANTPEKPDIGG